MKIGLELVMVIALASAITERTIEAVAAILTVTLAIVDLLSVLTVAGSEVPEVTVLSSLVA